MGSINKRPLKAFVRFDGSGRVVSGSLVLRRNKPKVGNWQEIVAYECCNPTTTTTTTVALPAGQISSTSDVADACSETLDTVVYLQLASGPSITASDIIYLDAAGATPFVGDDTYHRVASTDSQDWNVQISSTGVVLAATLCA
uniref:Uncharacterized protein n=1 Tax=Virus NIOZ-UU157 TaxID=2763269 RepID=A0A7S9SUE7_9VIRU|nr:MAG: hypothetical protein NIOZUU157_00344 [Virus NIOZ-UU157]